MLVIETGPQMVARTAVKGPTFRNQLSIRWKNAGRSVLQTGNTPQLDLIHLQTSQTSLIYDTMIFVHLLEYLGGFPLVSVGFPAQVQNRIKAEPTNPVKVGQLMEESALKQSLKTVALCSFGTTVVCFDIFTISSVLNNDQAYFIIFQYSVLSDTSRYYQILSVLLSSTS